MSLVFPQNSIFIFHCNSYSIFFSIRLTFRPPLRSYFGFFSYELVVTLDIDFILSKMNSYFTCESTRAINSSWSITSRCHPNISVKISIFSSIDLFKTGSVDYLLGLGTKQCLFKNVIPKRL